MNKTNYPETAPCIPRKELHVERSALELNIVVQHLLVQVSSLEEVLSAVLVEHQRVGSASDQEGGCTTPAPDAPLCGHLARIRNDIDCAANRIASLIDRL